MLKRFVHHARIFIEWLITNWHSNWYRNSDRWLRWGRAQHEQLKKFSGGKKQGFCKKTNFILVCNSLPLHIIVCIEETALPQASDFFCLFFCGISWHCDKHHQSLPLLRQLQDTFRLAWINFWEIYWCWRPLVFRKISLFNVIIFLFWKGKGGFKLNCSTKLFCFEISHFDKVFFSLIMEILKPKQIVSFVSGYFTNSILQFLTLPSTHFHTDS